VDRDTLTEARIQLAAFIADAPVYKCLDFVVEPFTTDVFWPRAIRRACDRCRAPTTWERYGEEVEAARSDSGSWKEVPETVKFRDTMLLSYRCGQCAQHEGYPTFLVWMTLDANAKARLAKLKELPPKHVVYTVTKIGQSEPWSVSLNATVRSQLTEEDQDLYRRALLNMSTSNGIGALAYLRRIVENENARLLALLETLAKEAKDDEQLARLEKAKGNLTAEERLSLIADVLPPSLTAGGHNPVKLLYGQFSVGMHGKSDSECLEIAKRLRDAFELVFTRIAAFREDQKTIARLTNA
jgi:hypothetical protein